jgi:hypothetical protein
MNILFRIASFHCEDSVAVGIFPRTEQVITYAKIEGLRTTSLLVASP